MSLGKGDMKDGVRDRCFNTMCSDVIVLQDKTVALIRLASSCIRLTPPADHSSLLKLNVHESSACLLQLDVSPSH